ncbi:YihY/virulence factor BrkB family protein [Cellulomonas sp. ATA003]|uniref:YihY/virulence factor BrkB family protein n=1 Tax=Cellulomonas sp. ATA003 TaxID=3073064 RepID=UPI002873430B|nr:YihY/virulence factor BrkB family protein [Cellulomonas sp. ATA003]WNB85049.1 YihY/virulence factor BrkB family protein [Cellulomonas sp. ATA003]
MAGKTDEHKADAPHPDDSRKPDELSDLTKPSWKYILRKTLREFGKDQCTDLAAALTYYGVLALFPGLLAVVSLVGLVGDPQETTDALLGVAGDLGVEITDTIEETIAGLATAPAAGLGLVTGLLGALWSASGFVTAFSRAMNRMYEVEEGRPFWKLRPIMLLITLIAVVIIAVVALALVVSGPLAEAIGNAVGLGDAALTVWSIAKWPVLAALVALVIAILYYGTPNVQQPKFRWMSVGAFVAIIVAVLASLGFGFYVANFSSYSATYGALAGVIIFLLWLWIMNNALLFGAELDAELERGRQLQAGIEAEETLQLPPRDTSKIEKNEEKHQEDVQRGRELRLSAGQHQGDGKDDGSKSR